LREFWFSRLNFSETSLPILWICLNKLQLMMFWPNRTRALSDQNGNKNDCKEARIAAKVTFYSMWSTWPLYLVFYIYQIFTLTYMRYIMSFRL
jgi:hypothetical protein